VATDQKGARTKSAWLVVFDESGVSLIPPVRRTWSVRGRTPILRTASRGSAPPWPPRSATTQTPPRRGRASTSSPTATTPTAWSRSWSSSKAPTPLSGWCRRGMGSRPTGATRCAPTWTPSAAGWWSSGCPPTPRSSTRSNTSGPTPTAPSRPTSPVTPWPRSPTRPSAASGGPATATAWWSGSGPHQPVPRR
jgi:hypothetical protein